MGRRDNVPPMRDLLLLAIHLFVTIAKLLRSGAVRAVAAESLILNQRLIGTLRREYLDRIFFGNALDLERKLNAFGIYYNSHRIHQSLSGNTPDEKSGKPRPNGAALHSYGWQQHCQGLFQIPVAA